MNLPIIHSLQEEIVFKKISQKKFHNEDAKSITVKNSTITKCVFDNVNLCNCDLLSSRVEDTDFIRTNLENADILSTWFYNCKFIDVDFTGASIEDINFISCEFHNCIFESVSVKSNTFVNGIFEHINPISSIFALNSYEECTFSVCRFVETFQFQIFTNCNYTQVVMDSSILKSNFGLGNIDGLSYQLYGKIINDNEQLKTDLINECIEKNCPISAVLVSYNFEEEINPQLAIKSLYAVETMIQYDILLRNDELIFLKNLYHYLYANKLIAPISLYTMFNKAKMICTSSTNNIAYSKSRDQLLLLANSLYFDFSDFCETLKKSMYNIPNYSVPIEIMVRYDQEPNIELSKLLNYYRPDNFRRVYTKQGSFIEGIEAGKYGLELLTIFLELLGIVVPIVYSEKKETRKKKTKDKSQVGGKIQKDVNIDISLQQNNEKAAEMIQQTCQMLTNTNILNDNVQGYNNSNIKEIKINYQISIHA